VGRIAETRRTRARKASRQCGPQPPPEQKAQLYWALPSWALPVSITGRPAVHFKLAPQSTIPLPHSSTVSGQSMLRGQIVVASYMVDGFMKRPLLVSAGCSLLATDNVPCHATNGLLPDTLKSERSRAKPSWLHHATTLGWSSCIEWSTQCYYARKRACSHRTGGGACMSRGTPSLLIQH
jgi:hypothetical protein